MNVFEKRITCNWKKKEKIAIAIKSCGYAQNPRDRFKQFYEMPGVNAKDFHFSA